MADNFNFTLGELVKLCDEDPKIIAQHLIGWGLIPAEGTYKCPKCGGDLKLVSDKSRLDGLRWACRSSVQAGHRKRKRCVATMEFRNGTIFQRSKLSLFQILGFVNLWVYQCSLSFISVQLKMSPQTAVEWASFCREVLLDTYVEHKEKLGGIGIVVEIEESKFKKRKFHRGHNVEGQWVFGGYERGTGRVFMVTVPDRASETLLPVIQDWIKPGTTIISDFWKRYDCLSLPGYEHLKLNHSLSFENPSRSAHTNAIESSWRASKKSSGGRRKDHTPGNLARYMFQKRCGELKLDRSKEFLRLAGLMYNPLSPYEHVRDEDATDESDIE